MSIDPSDLFLRLQGLAPFGNEPAARHAFAATLKALRRGLLDDEATWLADHLGSPLADPLAEETHAGELTVEELCRWMGHFAGLSPGVAREQTQAVCQVLTELLSDSAAQRLRHALPHLALLLESPEPREPAFAPPFAHGSPGAEHTLAGGRPGSSRPLYDAGPPGKEAAGGAVPTHSGSVVASDDPHAATKLSSSHGLTQEREHRSLSTAQPDKRK